MRAEDKKAVVRRFLTEGLGGPSLGVVDAVFAPDHALSSPEFGEEVIVGTDVIKEAIEELRDAGVVGCTVQRQIEEGDWVASSYTLREDQGVHKGILLSRVVAGRISESHVVARTISEAEGARSGRKAFN